MGYILGAIKFDGWHFCAFEDINKIARDLDKLEFD